MALIDGAPTQSRGRRPLPERAIVGKTAVGVGVGEFVRYLMEDGRKDERELLTWIGGQAGLLWGACPDVESLFGLSPDELMLTHGSYGHVIEHDLADTLAELFAPVIMNGERGVGVRFFQNGGDACAAAVWLCRAETGRQLIATQGYHGAQSDFGHMTPGAVYPPGYLMENVEAHRRFDFGDFEQVYQAAGYAAGLMIEVPGLDDEEQIREFLKYARHTADMEDIPLVIDDVVKNVFCCGCGRKTFKGCIKCKGY